MTRIIFLAILPAVLVLAQNPPPGGYYTTRYDYVNVGIILNQKRLVLYYAACLLDRGPCTPQGLEFKRILPEAIRTNCLRCTEKQRYVIISSIKRLVQDYPNVWRELKDQWDPTGDYLTKLYESINIKPSRSPEVEISDRFGDSEAEDNAIPTHTRPVTKSTFVFKSTNTPSTTTTTTSTTFATKTSPSTMASKPPTLSVSFATTDNSPKIVINVRPPVIPTNTVSFGGGLIAEPLRQLSSIGNKVVETGSRIAGLLFDTVQDVLGR